jgi:hypothetical protein
MFKKALTQSDYFIIAANLLPVAGVWIWNWSPKEVFMVYALETIIIGLFTLVKMGIVTTVRKTDLWYNGASRTRQPGLFFMLFFLVHYGIFVAIQTGLFIQVSGIARTYRTGFFDFIIHWPRYLGPDAYYMLAGFFISYGFSMYLNFIRTRRYRTISLMQVMFQPYGRIFIQQFTVILGSIFLSFGAGKIFILIFAAVKICFEVFVNYDGILNKAMKDMEKEPENNTTSP